MKLVLDTTAFSDARVREMLGASSLEEAVEKILDLLATASERLGYEFYTTPRVYEELRGFLLRNGCREETVDRLAGWIIVKSPSSLEVSIPAYVMYRYVGDLRRRMDKGLRVAEWAVRRAARDARDNAEAELDDVVGPLIHRLREDYRLALRHGIVDSEEDFELVLLARELDATLVTSDAGIRSLSESLGIRVVDAPTLVKIIRERLRLYGLGGLRA